MSTTERVQQVNADVDETIGNITDKMLNDEKISRSEALEYHYLICMRTTLVAEQASDRSYEDLAEDLEFYAEKVRELGDQE